MKLSRDGRHVPTVLREVEGMQDQAQRHKVLPDVVHLAYLHGAVEDQSGEHVGDLVRQDGRSMKRLIRVQPVLQVGAGSNLTLVGHDERDDNAGIDDDGHRPGSSATRASATRPTASACACF